MSGWGRVLYICHFQDCLGLWKKICLKSKSVMRGRTALCLGLCPLGEFCVSWRSQKYRPLLSPLSNIFIHRDRRIVTSEALPIRTFPFEIFLRGGGDDAEGQILQ